MAEVFIDFFTDAEFFLLSMLFLAGVGCAWRFVVRPLRDRRRGRRKERPTAPADAESLERLWRGLQRMERRIGNLETILIERERRTEKKEEVLQ
jgi:hypothetical protein